MSESSPPAPEPPKIERLSSLSFDRPIPKAVRAFGKALDPKILLPGDLLLVANRRPSLRSSGIIRQQSHQFADSHAKWHHAVVCGGGFEICEATTRGGVRAGEYWDYMNGKYDFKLRRLKDATAEERSRIAYYAVTNVRIGYGFLNLVGLALSLSRGNPWGRSMLISSGVICSQLYFEACLRAGFVLANAPAEHVCPAHLSISSQMVDVPLGWVAV
jgi:hypothetical protein